MAIAWACFLQYAKKYFRSFIIVSYPSDRT